MSKNKIKAFLHNNSFAGKKNKYVARVKIERSLTVKDVCIAAIKRDDVDITPADMEYLVSLWLEEMGYCLCNGYSVNTRWFTALPKIKGLFGGPEDSFNHKNHSAVFEFSQGLELKKQAKNVAVTILGMADVMAKILQVTDIHTGNINSIITKGRNLRINGSKIKIKGENPQNGVYFVEQNTLEQTKVDDKDVVLNKPSELIIIIPELAKGSYKLLFTSQYTGSVLLKKPRTIEFDKTLCVE